MNEREIFLAALEISDSVARQAYVENACGDNLVLRSQVESLLESHESADQFLAHPVAELPVTSLAFTLDTNDPTCQTAQLHEMKDLSGENQIGDEEENEQVPLGYLSPSSRSDSLGRLGHYEVLQILGKGAFGTVLKAFDEILHRMVAIKVMSAELATTSPARKRFLREARAAAAIRHENVVAIYAVEEMPVPYLVMEYIPGKTLAEKLIDDGPLDLANSLRLGQQIASGLAAAHSKGLIHRDIKPANILLEDGIQLKVKITDFGLARAADDASVTQSGVIAGTPLFMSPEQANCSPIDQRSDLFSFGSVLYQTVSGRPPFRAMTTFAVLKRVVEDTPRPIQEIIPEVPDWFCSIIGKLHEKDANRRYQTANEVAELLARCQLEMQQNGTVHDMVGSFRSPKELPSSEADNTTTNQLKTDVVELSAKSATLPSQTSWSISNRTLIQIFAAVTALFIGIFAAGRVLYFNTSSTADKASTGVSHRTAMSKEVTVPEKGNATKNTWRGWPTDCPSPAIAPFNSEQAAEHQEAWAKHLNVPVEYTNSMGMKFKIIPPGEFAMGGTQQEIEDALKYIPARWGVEWHDAVKGEHPQHHVVLTEAFYLGIHEVTQAQFEQVTGKNPSFYSSTGSGAKYVADVDSSRLPAENLTWYDAVRFCNALSAHEEISDPQLHYRLPTEAEWEFSCRAGSTTRYSNGDDILNAHSIGWFWGHGDAPHTGGELPANPFGIFDMHGNVWEWVNDNWQTDHYSKLTQVTSVNPTGPQTDSASRVMRGGTFRLASHIGRSAQRLSAKTTSFLSDRGFRVALPIDAVRNNNKKL